jgi:hypothetical protein
MTAKPSLAGILQRKGAAAKPAELPPRGAVAEPQAPPADKGKPRAMTLRLEEEDYQRLREFAFRRGLSHQAVMLDALRRHLDAEDASPAARSGTP